MVVLLRKKPIEYVVDNNGCFNCISHAKDRYGYRRINMLKGDRKVKSTVHRFVYIELFGEIPDNLVVMHLCDNRECINPEHLTIGTHQDNMDDMLSKGRKKDNKRKLTEEDVIFIRSNPDNLTTVQLAKTFNVGITAIKDVRNFRTYKHLTDQLNKTII